MEGGESPLLSLSFSFPSRSIDGSIDGPLLSTHEGEEERTRHPTHHEERMQVAAAMPAAKLRHAAVALVRTCRCRAKVHVGRGGEGKRGWNATRYNHVNATYPMQNEEETSQPQDNEHQESNHAKQTQVQEEEERHPEQGTNGDDKTNEGNHGLERWGLSHVTKQALEARGVKELFDVQTAVLQPVREGNDVVVRARTGTGKTLAFALPVIEALIQPQTNPNQKEENQEGNGYEEEPRHPMRRGRGRPPACLVLAPTRELASQVEKEFQSAAPSLSCACFYGGTPLGPQERALRNGVDVVVGTPGRVIDLLERGWLDLSQLQYVVLDEADQMLAIGFEEDVETILAKAPSERQTLLFSATMPRWVQRISARYLRNPLKIDLVGDENTGRIADTIQTYACRCTPGARRTVLVDLITVYGSGARTICFVQTKKEADELSLALGKTMACEALHGDIMQNQRERTLKGFRDGNFHVLIATDVAARGLDIANVDLVLHYDMPNDAEAFLHRSGRTGRAGKKGKAIVIFSERERRQLRFLEKDTDCKFEHISPPQPQEVMRAAALLQVERVKNVDNSLRPFFSQVADELLETMDSKEALTAALAALSGFQHAPQPKSLLTYEEGLTTIMMSPVDGSPPISSAREVMGAVGRILQGDASSVGKIQMCGGRHTGSAVFDVPSALADTLLANSGRGVSFELPEMLPQLMDSGRRERAPFRSGGYRSGGRGSRGYEGRSGGSRYGGRDNSRSYRVHTTQGRSRVGSRNTSRSGGPSEGSDW